MNVALHFRRNTQSICFYIFKELFFIDEEASTTDALAK